MQIIIKTKVYWLSIDKGINDHVNKCVACQANTFKHIPEPICMRLPEYPWSQIAIDYYRLLPSNEKLFVLVDNVFPLSDSGS